jgi:hypothetical protein
MLLYRLSYALAICLWGFKEDVSTLNVGADMSEAQFHEKLAQAFHFDEMAADIDAAQQRYIDHVLSFVLRDLGGGGLA